MRNTLFQNHRKLAITVAALLAGLVFFLASLPVAISYGLQKWMLDHGAKDVSLQDVDFNPFTGTLQIHQLSADSSDHQRLRIQGITLRTQWGGLFHRYLIFNNVVVHDSYLDVVKSPDGELQIAGIQIPLSGEETGVQENQPWGLVVEKLQVKDTLIRYAGPGVTSQLEIRDMKLTGLDNLAPGKSAGFQLDGSLDKSSITLSGELNLFSEQPGFDGAISTIGVRLDRYMALMPESMQSLQAIVTTNAQVAAHRRADGNIEITMQGSITGEQGQFVLPESDVVMSLGQVDWKGQFNFMTGPEYLFSISGGLTLNRLQLAATKQDYMITSASQLTTSGIKVTLPGPASVQQLQINDLAFGIPVGAKSPAVTEVGSLTASEIQYSDTGGIVISTIDLQDMVAYLERYKDGSWNIDHLKQRAIDPNAMNVEAVPDTQNDDRVKQDANTDMPVKIGLVTLAGDSRIDLVDHAVSPTFSEKFDIRAAHLEQIDSAQPGRSSSLNIQANAGSSARIHIVGGVSPFAQHLTLDLEGEVEGYSLPPLSSYMRDLVGYAIESGKLDAKMKLNIKEGNVDGSNELHLHQISVSRTKADNDAGKPKLDVPLETGLAMLRDDRNNVRLELPVKGSIEDIQIDPSDAINQALSKAFKQGAKTYLSTALFPYGTLLTIIQVAGDKAMQARLDPVEHVPGVVDIDEKIIPYLDKVADVLRERPELQIKLCGVASELDRTILQAKSDKIVKETSQPVLKVSDGQLISLAQDRADLLEQYFINKKSVKRSRLISCQARIDVTKESVKPRTELTL